MSRRALRLLPRLLAGAGGPLSSLQRSLHAAGEAHWRSLSRTADSLPAGAGQLHTHLSAPPTAQRRAYAAASDTFPPHTVVPMPSLSPTMSQGNLAKWRKKEGDKVAAGDVVAEIETDKATMEMESMEDGFVAKLLKTEGAQNIVVGEPVLIMVDDAALVPRFASYTAAAAAPAPAAPAAAAAVPTTAASSPSSGVQAAPPVPALVPARPSPVSSHVQQPARVPAGQRVFASPLARKLAADAGVAIEGISGTGPSGRIIRADVEEALARGTASAASASAGSAVPAGAAPSPLEVFFPDYQDVSLTNIKRVTAKRLTESKQTVPHFYLSVDVRMDALLAARQHMNDSLAAQGKGAAPAAVTKLSVNDWIIKAAAVACVRVPEVNSSWMGDRIRRYNAVDVSVAVQTDAGLMVPIVRNAHAKGLTAIGSDVRALAQKAREGKLAVEDMTGGTFTVSNLGMLGVKSFAAIVNPPQAGILAVGATRPEVRSVAGAKGQWEQVQVMTVTLSCDHRVVDGAVGAQWMAQFKQLVEEPMSMLL